MGFFLRLVRDGLLTMVIVFVFFEITLRIFPALIPPGMLIYFNEGLRSSIASRLNLPVENDSREISRDDNGPRLQIYKPGITIANQFDDIGTKSVTVDENGFCNEEGKYQRLENVDIVTIGDSFTFCTTVNPSESWTSQLETITQNTAYNLGVPYKGMYEYLQLLKTFGLEKHPDTVIMAVYEGNDLRDALKYIDYKEQRGKGAKETSQDCGNSRVCRVYLQLINSRIGQHSYAFDLLLVTVRVSRGKMVDSVQGVEKGGDFTYSVTGPEGVVTLNSDNADEDEVIHARKLKNGEISLDVFEDALVEFKKLSEEHKFSPVIIYIPSAYTAYATEAVFSDETILPVMSTYSDTQRAYFKEQTKRLDIVFLDTTPELQKAAPEFKTSSRLLYFPQNVHLTKYGHQVVAEVVADGLLSKINKKE